MGESLTMRRCVEDEGLRVVNSCHGGTGEELCASSRGNTEAKSVVRIYWA